MKTSIWYHTKDRQPDQSGYYLSYRGWGMGGKADSDHDHGYLYYHKKTNRWYEYSGEVRAMHPNTCIVYYWTDADPCGWVENDPPVVSRVKPKDNRTGHYDNRSHLSPDNPWIRRLETHLNNVSEVRGTVLETEGTRDDKVNKFE